MRLQSLKQRRRSQAFGLAYARGTTRNGALLLVMPPRPLQSTQDRAGAACIQPGFSRSISASSFPTRLLASAGREPARQLRRMLNRQKGPLKPAAQRGPRLVLMCCSKPNGCRCCSTGATAATPGQGGHDEPYGVAVRSLATADDASSDAADGKAATADFSFSAVAEAVFTDENDNNEDADEEEEEEESDGCEAAITCSPERSVDARKPFRCTKI